MPPALFDRDRKVEAGKDRVGRMAASLCGTEPGTGLRRNMKLWMAVRLDTIWRRRTGLLEEERFETPIDEEEQATRQKMGNNQEGQRKLRPSPTSLGLSHVTLDPFLKSKDDELRSHYLARRIARLLHHRRINAAVNF